MRVRGSGFGVRDCEYFVEPVESRQGVASVTRDGVAHTRQRLLGHVAAFGVELVGVANQFFEHRLGAVVAEGQVELLLQDVLHRDACSGVSLGDKRP